MTKAQIHARRQRWRILNDFEIAELQNTAAEVKFGQLAVLMAAVDSLNLRAGLEADDELGRRRWQQFRQRYGRSNTVST